MSQITQTLQKLRKYETNPEVFAELSNNELAGLVVHLMGAFSTLEKKIGKDIEDGRYDAYQPTAGKDYEPREAVLQAFQTYKAETSTVVDKKLSELDSEINKAIKEIIENIQDGEDGLVSDEEIQRAAEIAYGMLELPDFEELAATAITANPTSVRDSLELLQGDERLEQSAIKGLADTIQAIYREIARIPRGQGGGTIGTNVINKVILDRIADGTIGNGGGAGGHTIQDEGVDLTARTNLNFIGVSVTVTDNAGADSTDVTISAGSGSTTNNYASLAAPQAFNPDAGAVTANTADFTLSSSNSVALVTLDGLVLDDSEYSLASSTLTVTPINGFSATDQEVLVFQNAIATSATGFTTAFAQKSATYTIETTDHTIECTANTFTITLPTAVGIGGQQFVIKNSGTGVVTVDGNGSETIDGATTAVLSTQYESVTLISNGSNFIII